MSDAVTLSLSSVAHWHAVVQYVTHIKTIKDAFYIKQIVLLAHKIFAPASTPTVGQLIYAGKVNTHG